MPLRALPAARGDATTVVAPDGRELRVRAPTTRDLLAARDREDPARALLTACVSDATGAPADPDELGEETLDLVDAAAEELAGAAAIVVRAACPDCGEAVAAPLDVGALLWERVARAAAQALREVAELAAAFGWSEAEVLALTPLRRARVPRARAGWTVTGFFARMGDRAAGREAPLRAAATRAVRGAVARGGRADGRGGRAARGAGGAAGSRGAQDARPRRGEPPAVSTRRGEPPADSPGARSHRPTRPSARSRRRHRRSQSCHHAPSPRPPRHRGRRAEPPAAPARAGDRPPVARPVPASPPPPDPPVAAREGRRRPRQTTAAPGRGARALGARAGAPRRRRPAPGPAPAPALDLAALLREHVVPALVDRGAVSRDERPVVAEPHSAAGARRQDPPRPGTVGRARDPAGHLRARAPQLGDPEERDGSPAVHLHIDRVVVTRAAPPAPPAPASPPRAPRRTVDHAAYLARRRERP